MPDLKRAPAVEDGDATIEAVGAVSAKGKSRGKFGRKKGYGKLTGPVNDLEDDGLPPAEEYGGENDEEMGKQRHDDRDAEGSPAADVDDEGEFYQDTPPPARQQPTRSATPEVQSKLPSNATGERCRKCKSIARGTLSGIAFAFIFVMLTGSKSPALPQAADERTWVVASPPSPPAAAPAWLPGSLPDEASHVKMSPPSPSPPPPAPPPPSPPIPPPSPLPSPPQIDWDLCANDWACTSPGNDCCAPSEFDEEATCSDGFIPVLTGDDCFDFPDGYYVCCAPT